MAQRGTDRALVCGLAAVLSACGSQAVDVGPPGLATPERTVETLLEAVRIEPEVSVRDQAAFGACFADAEGPADPRALEAARRLAAAGTDRRVILFGDRATITLPAGERIWLRRDGEAYRIVLAPEREVR
ncbi:MAG: hypothetical protein ACFCGT_26845 [Sandaracinaceae bacterium]